MCGGTVPHTAQQLHASHTAEITSITLHSDGYNLLSGGKDGRVYCYDLKRSGLNHSMCSERWRQLSDDTGNEFLSDMRLTDMRVSMCRFQVSPSVAH